MIVLYIDKTPLQVIAVLVCKDTFRTPLLFASLVIVVVKLVQTNLNAQHVQTVLTK